MITRAADDGIDLSTPPRRLRVRPAGFAGAMEVTRFAGSVASAIFPFLWLIGWTVGCLMVVNQALTQPTFINVLFGIPFVASWFAVAGFVLYSFTSREVIIVSRDGLIHRKQAIIVLRRRTVLVDDIGSISIGDKPSKRQDCSRQMALRIETTGKPIYVGAGLSRESLEWLRALIDYTLAARPATLIQHAGPLTSDHRHSNAHAVHSEIDAADESVERQAAKRGEVGPLRILMPERETVTLPDDTHLRVIERTGLAARIRTIVDLRKWLGGVLVITFFCAFWNGIVGVFIYQLFTNFQWGLFFFLIPFEVIGLIILGVWLLMLFAPAFRIEWTFEHNRLTERELFLGFTLSRPTVVALNEVVRIELHRSELRNGVNEKAGLRARTRRWCMRPNISMDFVESNGLYVLHEEDSQQYRLVLIGRDGNPLLDIDPMTIGEARFFAQEVFNARR